MELGFWTYGLITFSDPRGPNLASRLQVQEIFQDLIVLFDSTYDSGENEVLFMKIGTRVLDLWLDISSGPRCLNAVSRPQTLRSWNFLRFHNIIGFIL